MLPFAARSLQMPDPTATGAEPTFPFPDSVWTDTVPASPTVKQKSATLVANLLTQGYGADGSPSGFYVGANDGTPRYVVHGQEIAASYGWTTIYVYNNQSTGDPSGYVIWPVPMGWQNSTGTDAEFCMWDLDSHTQGTYTGSLTYNAWSFQRNTSTDHPGQCFTQQTCPTDGSYAGFGAWSQDSLTTGTTTASGAPYIATNITQAEFLYGSIDHALALTIAQPTSTYYVPAIASDGTTALSAGGVPYGTLFYLPSSVAEPDWSTTGATAPTLCHQVFEALKNYGMYAVDQTAGNGCDLAVEAIEPWKRYDPALAGDGVHWPIDTGTAYNAFLGMPWSEMEVIVPSRYMGSGGGGTSALRASGNSVAIATTTPATITIPSAVEAGDILVLFCTFVGQSYNDGSPTGWTYLGNGEKASTDYAVYTKTAVSTDPGSTFTMGFAGSGLLWDIVAVSGSTGATFSQSYADYGFIGTLPSTLNSGQNLTLLYASVPESSGVTYWPDGYTEVNWLTNSTQSGGVGVFNGAAYGNDAFVPSGGGNAFGLQVAV